MGASQPKWPSASSREMAVTGLLQVLADDVGDVADRYTLVANAMQSWAGGRCFQGGEPEQVRGVESVHGGPAVGTVAPGKPKRSCSGRC